MATFRLNRHLKTALKIMVSLGALYWVITNIEFREVIRTFKETNIFWLSGALGLFIISKTLAAFRLNRYLKDIGIQLSQIYNLRLYLLGMFYNLFLPGGIGGDGYKIYLLNKNHEAKGKHIFSAILADRLNGMLALVCIAIVLSLFIQYPPVYKYFVWLLIPAALLVFYYSLRYIFKSFTGIYYQTTLYSFMVQTAQVICALFILFALNMQEHTLDYIFVFLVSSIVATIPFTIGGLGAREVTFLYGAKLMGLNIDVSIALSFSFYLITAFTSFWGIWYHLKGNLARNQQ